MRAFEKLKWRCRRGVVELDILLLRYLENDYLRADRDEQAQFVELLTWEDDELLSVLVGGKTPAARGFDTLIDKIGKAREGVAPGGLGDCS